MGKLRTLVFVKVSYLASDDMIAQRVLKMYLSVPF